MPKRINERELVSLTQSLVRIPSMIRGVDSGDESKIAEFIASRLEKSGFSVKLQEAKAGRPNVIATLKGEGDGYNLMLNGHLDTVEATGMTIDPFAAKVKDRCLYGRGAADMKAALAAFIHVAEIIKQTGVKLRGNLIVSGCADEEGMAKGGEVMAKSGLDAHLAVVGEPTGMRVCIGHKGLAFIMLKTFGKATHGSAPELGVNAILAMNRLLTALSSELPRRFKQQCHPLLGSPTFNVGMIRGGYRANVVPDFCEVEIDRRLIPGETTQTALQEIRAVIEKVRRQDSTLRVEVSALEWVKAMPMEIPRNEYIVIAMCRSFEAVTGKKAEIATVPYWTDASSFVNLAKIPTVVFGPGELVQAHSAAEYIDIDALVTFAKVIALLALDVCTKRR